MIKWIDFIYKTVYKNRKSKERYEDYIEKMSTAYFKIIYNEVYSFI